MSKSVTVTATVTVAVIATVLNEADTISNLLESLAHQTRRPDAVIIVDGGSIDGTVDILYRWQSEHDLPLQVIEAAGANISQGRNIAIGAAETEVIAGTDAGTWLAPDWLQNLTAPFEQDPPADVVAGFFVADPQTSFETALGATTLPIVDDVNPDRFLPSSRSIAFRRSVWQELDGYPEWLDFCEDLLFDLWLRQEDYRVVFAPDAVAYFRPRRSLRRFFWQYYRYARGDGKADLWPLRHAIRYFTYLIAAPTLLKWAMGGSDEGTRNPSTSPLRQAQDVASMNSGRSSECRAQHAIRTKPLNERALPKRRNLAGLLLLAGSILMFRPPIQRLWRLTRDWPWSRRLRALLWVPLIRVTGDVAKMLGYPVGRWWRWQHRRELHDVRERPPFALTQIFDRS